MEKTRTDLFSLVKTLRESALITESDANAFKDVIKKSEVSDLPELEDMILEAAENMSDLLTDIKFITESIYPEFHSYKKALQVGRELESKLSIMKVESIDVFEIYSVKSFKKVKPEEKHKLLVFHLIINVEYNGTVYGFGFNKAHKAVSYKIGEQGPLFDNISQLPDDYEEAVRLLSYLVQYIMDIV